MSSNAMPQLSHTFSESAPSRFGKNVVPILKFAKEANSASDSADIAWQAPALNSICRFLEMDEGWDSYGAKAIGKHTAMFTLEFMQQLMQPETPPPNIVPTSVGGIQLEWNKGNIDLEVHVRAPYEIEFLFSDESTGEDREGQVTDDFQTLSGFFAAISR